MAKKNRNEWDYTLKLKKDVPAHAKVIEIIEDYQQQTGLSKKDSLVMIVLGYGSSIKNNEVPLETPLNVIKGNVNNQVSFSSQDKMEEEIITKDNNTPAKVDIEKQRDSIMDDILDISGVEALISSNYEDV